MTKKDKQKMLKITQIKSPIGYRKRAWQTLEALGLRRMHHTVIKPDNAAMRGMTRSISHLVRVEEIKD